MAAIQANRAHLAGRENAVEDFLRLGGQGPDFVQQESAAVGDDQLAGLRPKRARECAFLVTEQLAVDDIARDRLAIEQEERAASAQARRMDCPRNRLLAGARLADDQDRQPVARRLRRDGESGADLGSRAYLLLELKRRRELLGDRDALAGALAAVGSGRERFEQPLGRDGPYEEIGRAGAHRLDRRRNAVAVRKDDHRQLVALLAKGFDEPRPALAPPCADEDSLHLASMRALQQTDCSLVVGGSDNAPAGARGDGGDQPPLVRIRVDQQ
jgi:hypothetical protein